MATEAEGRGRRIGGWRRAGVLVPVLLACLAARAPSAVAAIPAPVDLDGTWAASLVCGAEEFNYTLSVRGWYGYTGDTELEPLEQGRFEDRRNESGNWEVEGKDEGDFVYPSGYELPRMTLTRVSPSLEMRSEKPVGGCGELVMVNAAPQKTPSISGVVERAPGVPFADVGVRGAAPGVAGGQEVRAIAHTSADGSYAFWFEPGPDLVEPHVEPKPASDFAVTECSGRAGEGSCAIGLLSGEQATASFLFTQGSEISGTVTEAGGGALAGITLTLTGTTATGESIDQQTISSSEQGRYVFAVPTGTYTVTPTQPSEPSLGRILVTSCSGTIVPGACEITLTESQPTGSANFRRDPLIVNSTETATNTSEAEQGVCDVTPGGASQTCTLAQAIEVVNHSPVPGKTIGFDIPGTGVPQIGGADLGVDIEKPVVIDGYSQPETGRVELSGTGWDEPDEPASKGIVVGPDAAGSTIEGMVINGYHEQIVLMADSNKIQGDYLGTNTSGTREEEGGPPAPVVGPSRQIAVEVESSGNQIGGPGPEQGNVMAIGFAAISDAQPFVHESGNVIQGNAIGVRAASTVPLPPGYPGLALQLIGSATVGGSAPGDGNVIRGTVLFGGASVLQGNTIVGSLVGAYGKATIGGQTSAPGTGPGNTLLGSQIEVSEGDEIEEGGEGTVIQGNKIAEESESAIMIRTDHVTVGGSQPDLGNLIQDSATESAHPPAAQRAAIVINTAHDGGYALIEHNTFERNGNDGAVTIEAGDRDTITDNQMMGNSNGIILGSEGYWLDGERQPNADAPNDYEWYPILDESREHSGIEVTGRLPQPPTVPTGATFTVDIYSMSTSCPRELAGEGEHLLGSAKVVNVIGEKEFTVHIPSAAAGQHAITATATAPDGSTSEFSPCLQIGGKGRKYNLYGVTPTSRTVAISASSSSASAASRRRHRSKAGTGRGVLELQCPAITTGRCAGSLLIRTHRRHPAIVIRKRFTIMPGFVDRITINLAAGLFAELRKAHRLLTAASISSHDGGKHPRRKRTNFTLALSYA
ncbi:MAG TPA: hypothetical protein VMF09_16225 [Solirubrobacteraceae bacterium]|nr:hypothetical protein [Solirubrobacteraceae bacterium]